MSFTVYFLLFLTGFFIVMMAYDRVERNRGRLPGIAFSATLLFSIIIAMSTHALTLFGWQWCAVFFMVSTLFPYMIEGIGIRYGFIFGKYAYESKIGPKGPFRVPIVVALIWPSILYISVLVSTVILGLGNSNTGLETNWRFVLIAAIIATVTDLFIEPISVDNGYWRWSEKQWFPRLKWGTIPLHNFAGWFLTALITVYLAVTFANQVSSVFIIERWVFALPLVWIGSALFYTIGEVKRINRTGIARFSFILGLIAFALFVFYIV